jgi:hypothetical protein
MLRGAQGQSFNKIASGEYRVRDSDPTLGSINNDGSRRGVVNTSLQEMKTRQHFQLTPHLPRGQQTITHQWCQCVNMSHLFWL